MAFCMNCGKELPDGAKFCAECGAQTTVSSADSREKRETVYEGTIFKCPNCGDILDAYESVCETCGYERRGAKANSSVSEFSEQLNNASSENQKVDIIRNFPIPNNKEDIFEFMILASSNIDDGPNKEVFDAWIAKFNQCYQKAKLSFKQESDFIKIQSIYEKTQTDIKKIRRKGPIKKILTIVLPIVLLIIIGLFGLKSCADWLANPEPHGTDEEVARLEAIVVEVEKALDNKEYDYAMMQAKSIDFFPNHEAISDHERQWDIKRDYLIKKIISAAAKDGMEMEYPTDTADEKDQKEKSSGYDYKKSKQDIQSNIDEFNKYMDEVEDIWNQNTSGKTEE